MNTRSIFVFVIFSLFLLSAIETKKVTKGEKKVAKEPKVKKAKVVVVEEVSHSNHEQVNIDEATNVQNVISQAQEDPQQPAASKLRATPPKSLKVTNAYEQCKLECRKQRDSIQAKDYVEQLRAELEAAEAALAAENQHLTEEHNVQTAH